MPPAKPLQGLSIWKLFNLESFAQSAARNFFWLIADRGLRLILAFTIGSWVVRYLGQADFGRFSYAFALVSIFAAIAPLGMEALAVRQIVKDESNAGGVIGTVVALRLAASAFLVAIGATVVSNLRPDDLGIQALVIILGLGMTAQSLESGELLFQARTQMQCVVVPRLAIALAGSAGRAFLILSDFGLIAFGVMTAVEQLCLGVVSIRLARKHLPKGSRLSIRWGIGRRLLGDSWPLALAAAAFIIYVKIGQLMIGQMLGDAELGVYVAAVRVPEAAYFVPVVLASTLTPSLFRARDGAADEYHSTLLRYFRLSALLGYVLCIALALGASLIESILYGEQYRGSGRIMALTAWSLLFVFLGVARGQHLLNEKLTALSLAFSLSGLLLSYIGNLILIPTFGLLGAVWATLISYGFSGFFSSFLDRRTRVIGRLQALALVTPWMIFAKTRR